MKLLAIVLHLQVQFSLNANGDLAFVYQKDIYFEFIQKWAKKGA